MMDPGFCAAIERLPSRLRLGVLLFEGWDIEDDLRVVRGVIADRDDAAHAEVADIGGRQRPFLELGHRAVGELHPYLDPLGFRATVHITVLSESEYLALGLRAFGVELFLASEHRSEPR